MEMQFLLLFRSAVKSLDVVGSDTKLAADRTDLNIFTWDTYHGGLNHVSPKTSLSPVSQVPIDLKNS